MEYQVGAHSLYSGSLWQIGTIQWFLPVPVYCITRWEKVKDPPKKIIIGREFRIICEFYSLCGTEYYTYVIVKYNYSKIYKIEFSLINFLKWLYLCHSPLASQSIPAPTRSRRIPITQNL